MTEEEKIVLELLQASMDKKMDAMNHQAFPEMDNLSPMDMHHILYATFEAQSPIGFKEKMDDELLEKIPFLSLMLKYLGIVQEAGSIKLTTRGNLPRKVCFELYEAGFIKEKVIESGITKLSKEGDSISIQNVKIISSLSGLTKKVNNKISLTKKGSKLLAANSKASIFKTIFTVNCTKFNMGYHDGYPQNAGVQHTFGFTLYLLLKYGQKARELSFYVEKNLMAFPHILDNFLEERWSTSEIQYQRCYYHRIFNLFLKFYGLVDYKKEPIKGQIDDKITIKATPAFYDLFEIKKTQFQFSKSKFEA